MRKKLTLYLCVLASLFAVEVQAQKTYSLVSSVDALAVGEKYVFTNRAHTHAMAAQTTNNRAATDEGVTFNADFSTITINNAEVEEITLVAGVAPGEYAFRVADGYLFAASSEKNYLRTQANINANASATISFSEGQAIITFQGANTHNQLKFNYSSTVFACYSTGQQLIRIYKYIPLPTHKKGDVNGDGNIDVDDVNCLIDIILGVQEATSFNGRALVNDDNEVDVDDINAVIEIILN